jgi:hypothetical protein
MVNNVFRKSLVFGIIILLIGTGVISGINIKNGKVKDDYFSKKTEMYPVLDEPSWQWAKGAGGANWDCGEKISIDSNGNIYVTGEFQGIVSFGDIVLTSYGDYDVFIAKLDNDGNCIWAKNVGGIKSDLGHDICVDSNGNSYIIGEFIDEAFFGSIILKSFGEGNGCEDIFIAKLDNDGNCIWAKNAGGIYFDIGLGITVDSNGNLYVTGGYYSDAKFGNFVLIYSGGNGESDLFVAKLDTDGNWIWAKNARNYNTDVGYGVCIDSDGSIYAIGWFRGTISFGDIVIISNDVDFGDVFVVKLDNDGNWLWANSAGGNREDYGFGISVDSNCNSYVTGIIRDIVSFGDIIIQAGDDSIDYFVAKLDNDGNWIWAKNSGSTGWDEGCDICIDSKGNSYITGDFDGTLSFGDIVLICNGEIDIFVAKLDTDGNWIWAKNSDGISDVVAYGVCVNSIGSVYVIGGFNGTTLFGDTFLVCNGQLDIFVAKLGGENLPPNTPSDPEPADGAADVSVYAVLTWTCSDPDGDDLIYDVYFGTSSTPPLVYSNASSPFFNPPGVMEYDTKYYWKILAVDEFGASTAGPVWSFTTTSVPNNPPDIPSDPSPQDEAVDVNLDISVSWSCSDPDGDELVYDVYFEANDNTPDIKVSDDQNVNIFNTDTLQINTTYYWQIIAKDEHGASTPGPVWSFTTRATIPSPPGIPIINGPTSGKPGDYFTYTFVSIDPDNDNVFYQINWGYGTIEDWFGPYESNELVSIVHGWDLKGKFTIQARAKDVNGDIGGWGTLDVTIPRNKIVTNMFLQRFYENHPYLFQLIQKFMTWEVIK